MKIALFSTDDGGGAGRAALRLHKGLTQLGHDSSFFSRWKTAGSIEAIQLTSPEVANRLIDKVIAEQIQQKLRTGNTMCSAMYPSVGFDFLNIIRNYDIVNLHWIAMFLSVEAIAHIRQMGKPIVWTLHDQNPMTGVCHYTNGCNKYETVCTSCPQMKQDRDGLVRTFFEAKLKYIPQDLVVVSPSRWLADCARKSAIFRNHRIEVIANSVETDIFVPLDKTDAKRRLGIAENAKVVLFGATTARERRKGFFELIKATELMLHDVRLEELIAQECLHVLTVGHPLEDMVGLDLPHTSLGYVEDDQRLALAYSAADVLVLPSLEDNLPNLMLESLACGTPVVAFNTGGMSDVIRNGENGYLVSLGDISCMADKIIKVLTGKQMGNMCRHQAEERFRLEHQAQKYMELFSQLTAERERIFNAKPVPIVFPEVAQALGQPLINAAVEMQKEYDEMASYLNNLIAQNSDLLQQQEQLAESHNTLTQHSNQLLELNKELTAENLVLRQEQGRLEALLQENAQQADESAKLLDEKEQHIALLSRERDEKKQHIALLSRERDEKEQHIALLSRERDEKKQHIALLSRERDEKEQHIALLSRERDEKEQHIALLSQERDRLIAKRKALLQQVSQQADLLAKLRADRERHIIKMGDLVIELYTVYLSRSWRITRPLRYLNVMFKKLFR